MPKSSLHAHCLELLQKRATELQDLITAINNSKHNETKSSAGDKYETGRAMMQLEEDKINAQLSVNQQTYQQLNQVKLTQSTDYVQSGSLVTTAKRIYFLSVGLGKIELAGQVYYCISPDAPIGKLLWGKAAGATISFNGIEDKVLTVE